MGASWADEVGTAAAAAASQSWPACGGVFLGS